MRFVLRAAHAVLVTKDGVQDLDIGAILRRRRGELHHHLGLLAEAEITARDRDAAIETAEAPSDEARLLGEERRHLRRVVDVEEAPARELRDVTHERLVVVVA